MWKNIIIYTSSLKSSLKALKSPYSGCSITLHYFIAYSICILNIP